MEVDPNPLINNNNFIINLLRLIINQNFCNIINYKILFINFLTIDIYIKTKIIEVLIFTLCKKCYYKKFY